MKHPEKVQPAASAAAESVAETTGGVNEGHDTAFTQPEVTIEYMSVPDFIRRIPHAFHMDEVARFGSKVGQIADGSHCSYKSRVDKMLGECRVFPANLLRRVYEVMSCERKWPALIEAVPALPEAAVKAKEVIGANERAERALDGLTERIDDAKVLTLIEAIREYIRTDTDRLRQELATLTVPAITAPAN